ncbi:hypothetical protein [Acinetobacter haemolyticus]
MSNWSKRSQTPTTKAALFTLIDDRHTANEHRHTKEIDEYI